VAAVGGPAIGTYVEAPRAPVAQLPVSLPPRPALLAGREELLADLDARLTAGTWPRVVALHGLGGAGKTTVAVEYAHRHLAEVGLAWQFPAEDATVLVAEFGRLAELLGAAGGVLERRDPVAAVHAVLAGESSPWLLVFDNAPDSGAVREYLPPAGKGRVLITSRGALWPPGQGLEVPPLEVAAAAGFLASRTGDPDGQAAAVLAAELGGLPLALEQAAAYLQATGGSLAGYLTSFRKRRPELLARGKPTGYDSTVAATWSLAFTELQQSAPAAVGLLRLLAFCAPEPVPLRLLLQPRPGLAEEVAPVLGPLLDDDLAAGDAVAALRRYSLLTLAGDGLVLVHRLVQAVTADQMPGDLRQAWQTTAAALMEAAIPDATRLPETWPACALLLPHARAVLGPTSGGMGRIARYLGWSGSYPAARDLWQLIADAYKDDDAYGPEHWDTLRARGKLAGWTGWAGDAAGARDQFAALLPVEERVLGAEHPETLNTRGSLAYFTGEAGDAAGARDQYAALLPVEERVLGAEHRDTLTDRGHLARWTGEAGDAAAARDQHAALLPIEERVLGAEHPDTLTTRHDLANWTGEAGDAAGARDQCAELLPIRERVLGPEHPATLRTRGNLANWTGTAGDAAGARDQFAELLPIQVRVSGPEHPDTLTTRRNLAFWTGQTEDGPSLKED
jgi:Tetratricopeptide repeat